MSVVILGVVPGVLPAGSLCAAAAARADGPHEPAARRRARARAASASALALRPRHRHRPPVAGGGARVSAARALLITRLRTPDTTNKVSKSPVETGYNDIEGTV